MSDNAKYMLKCVREVLHPAFPKMHHSTCWAHIINLVESKWVDFFADVNSFVFDMKTTFIHAPARKHRYIKYLKRIGRNACLPPEPVPVRWNSWFDAIKYYSEHFDVYPTFVKKEIEESSIHVSI